MSCQLAAFQPSDHRPAGIGWTGRSPAQWTQHHTLLLLKEDSLTQTVTPPFTIINTCLTLTLTRTSEKDVLPHQDWTVVSMRTTGHRKISVKMFKQHLLCTEMQPGLQLRQNMCCSTLVYTYIYLKSHSGSCIPQTDTVYRQSATRVWVHRWHCVHQKKSFFCTNPLSSLLHTDYIFFLLILSRRLGAENTLQQAELLSSLTLECECWHCSSPVRAILVNYVQFHTYEGPSYGKLSIHVQKDDEHVTVSVTANIAALIRFRTILKPFSG